MCTVAFQSKQTEQNLLLFDYNHNLHIFIFFKFSILESIGLTVESLATIWTEFNETFVELDDVRNNYFTDSILVIGEIKTHMNNSNDVYFTTSQNVLEWIDLMQPLLSIHSIAKKPGAHRKILDKALDDGITKLSFAQQELDKISMSFNPLVSNFVALNAQYDDEFDKKQKCFQSKLKILRAASANGPIDTIEKELIPKILEKIESYRMFRSDLRKKIQQQFHNIDGMKAKLREEIQYLGDLKVKIEPVISLMNMDPIIQNDVEKNVKVLIADCNKYRKTHKN